MANHPNRPAKNAAPEGVDMQLGDVFLIGARLWRIVRFTPARAYVERIQGIGPLPHALSAQLGGLHIDGTDRVGFYIPVEFVETTNRRLASAVRLERGLADEWIVYRGHRASRAAKPHSDRIAQLKRDLAAEEQAERKAIVDALTGPLPEEEPQP